MEYLKKVIIIYFLAISTDFVLEKDKKYYPKVPLKACKYIGEEKQSKYINYGIEISFEDSDEEEFNV